MTKQARVRFIHSIVSAALLVILAVCFAVGSVTIYRSADANPYTYESVGRVFGYIAVPLVLCLLAVVGGIIIHFACPTEEQKLRAKPTDAVVAHRLAARTNIDAATESDLDVLGALRFRRRLFYFINIAVYAVLVIYSAISCLISLAFATAADEHGKLICIGQCAIVLLIASAIAFAVTVARLYTDAASYRRECDVLRGIMKREGGTLKVVERAGEDEQQGSKPVANIIRVSVAVIAVVFIIVGICNGGMRMLLENAITLCKSCVGIG